MMDPQTRHGRTFSLSTRQTHTRHLSSTSTDFDSSRESSLMSPMRHRLPPAASRRYYESTSRSQSKGQTSRSQSPIPRYPTTTTTRRSRSPRREERLSKYDRPHSKEESYSPKGRRYRSRSRSRSKDRYSRRSRSRARKPLTIDPRQREPTADPKPTTTSISASQPSSPTKQKSVQRPESNQFFIPPVCPGFRRQSLPIPPKPATKFADLNALANAISATVSASKIPNFNIQRNLDNTSANVANSEALPERIPDNSKAFKQQQLAQFFDKKPDEVEASDSAMEIDDEVSQQVPSKEQTSKPAALIDHDIKRDENHEPSSPILSHHPPGKPPMATTETTPSQDGDSGPQGPLWDRLRDFSQANSTWVRLRAEHSRLQAKSGGTEGLKLEDLQKYGESAYRRCERMIAVIVDEVVQKVNERIQAEGLNCRRCERLEQRIRVLEQERIDEEALMARLERNLDSKIERMVEERLAKRLSEGGGHYLTSSHSTSSHNELPPAKKRKRLNETSPTPASPTTVTTSVTAINDANEARLAKLESTLTKWDLRLHEALGWEYRAEADPTSLPAEDVPQSLKQRIEKLEEDSQQVFGYLSAHHHALSTLDATLSLDPSKPLGQGLHRHLSSLRAEMAQMLTDAFGSLEDSIARMVVGVVIKQTKAEMDASYHKFSKELQEKFTSSSAPMMRPQMPATTAVPSNMRPVQRTSSIQLNSGAILPPITFLPSMNR